MQGQTICVVHGGNAPQNRQAAERRLALLVHPAISVYQQCLLDYKRRPQLAATVARDILDRTGYKVADIVQTNGTLTIEVEYVGEPPPTVVDVDVPRETPQGRPLIEFLELEEGQSNGNGHHPG